MSSEDKDCALRRGNLTSDTGFVAEAEQYPYAMFCSSCKLLGTDLEIQHGVGAVTVTAQHGPGDRRVADHCVKTRQERYR